MIREIVYLVYAREFEILIWLALSLNYPSAELRFNVGKYLPFTYLEDILIVLEM